MTNTTTPADLAKKLGWQIRRKRDGTFQLVRRTDDAESFEPMTMAGVEDTGHPAHLSRTGRDLQHGLRHPALHRAARQAAQGQRVLIAMSKRDRSHRRRKRDRYDTPPEAVLPLLRHLPEGVRFAEPCAGKGLMVDALVGHGRVCTAASDIAPRRDDIARKDALGLTERDLRGADFVVTNTPWTRWLQHELIVHLSDLRPAWLLLDADWVHTKHSIPYMPRLRIIQSVGRVKWITHSKSTGYDNAAWHLFDKPSRRVTKFYGRQG